ncbi:MAG: aldo/keto reductase [Pseudomonadota bacterium]|nr:aldo/keto reductase [Pseudomonadota bacterium]
MQRVTLHDGLSLSRLIYGMWRLADDDDQSASYVQAKIEACLEQGITSMDQADIYGDYGAEEILGNALRAAPHLRDRIEIITKCDIVAPAGRHSGARVKYYDTSPAHITASVEDSLRLMGLERIELLLLHRPDPLMDHQATGQILDSLIASGKIGAAGVSNFKPHDWSLLQSAMSNRLATNQIEISVIANQAFSNGDLAFLQQQAVPPMAWSPLAGGALFNPQQAALKSLLTEKGAAFGVDCTAVAIAWLLAHPATILPVLGTNKLSRIAGISEALRVQLNKQDWFEIYQMANGHEVA